MEFKPNKKCISAVLAVLMVSSGTNSLYSPVQAVDTSTTVAEGFVDAVSGGNKVGGGWGNLDGNNGTAVTSEVVKIMPIGDSITFGMGETGGYLKGTINSIFQRKEDSEKNKKSM